jgi:hypothetical protein
MSYGQNLSSTSGEPEFIVQKFFEIPASGDAARLPAQLAGRLVQMK